VSKHFRFIDVPPSRPQEKLCSVVAAGLNVAPKQLACRFFYDTLGSQLFEQICALPEYYVTRTEQSILTRYAHQIVEATGDNILLAELGSGSSSKTRLLIKALLTQQPDLHYAPIDISAEFLRASCYDLLDDYPMLAVTGIAAEYNDGIRALPEHPGPRLILFLGSNIGNFERQEAVEFLSRIRARMTPCDRILIGVDLVKDRRVLHAAYNDAAGVTALFNKNLLVRINRELGGDFHLDRFHHEAPYNESESRIEMHLRSDRAQTVTVDYLEQSFTFEQEETIHTENSHKYTPAGFAALCADAGLNIQDHWTDEREWFAVVLLQPASPTAQEALAATDDRVGSAQ
jgi:L-histidine N-alpha-methyltransferase